MSVLLCLLGIHFGCSPSLRTAPKGVHLQGGGLASVVDSPPPPAKVESVPPDPGEPCVWVDGQWLYRSQRFTWQPGDWVLAEPGCYYAEPVTTWVESTARGLLYYIEGAWYDQPSGKLCRQPRSCTAPLPQP